MAVSWREVGTRTGEQWQRTLQQSESLNTEKPNGIHPIFISPKKLIEAVSPSILSDVPEVKVKSPKVLAVRLPGPSRVTAGAVRVYETAHVMFRLPIVSVTEPPATRLTLPAYTAISSVITCLTALDITSFLAVD